MRVALVENTHVTHHGQIGVALAEAGAVIDVFRPFAGSALPDPGAHDALVVFGGEQSALDDERHPYLPALADLMRRTADTGRAVLGLCLGAQVFARGLGAQNRLGGTTEFGWCAVERTQAGAEDALLSAAPARFLATQWHSDTFSLPDGAVHLARSSVAHAQAFRYGRAGYGTQFHFEAHRGVVADWLRHFPEMVTRTDPDFPAHHARRAKTEGAEADAVGLALARRWVSLI